MFLKISVISAYVLMIVIIGILRSKKTTSFNEFFLGGGNVGPWMTAFTYGATYFSAVVFIGFAGKVGWQFGYSGLWIAMGNSFLGVLAVWWLLGRPHQENVPGIRGGHHGRVFRKTLPEQVPESFFLGVHIRLLHPLFGRSVHRPVLPVQAEFQHRVLAGPGLHGAVHGRIHDPGRLQFHEP